MENWKFKFIVERGLVRQARDQDEGNGPKYATLPSGASIRHKGARAGPAAVLVIRRWRSGGALDK